MLASFFASSKPVNTLVVIIYMIIAYSMANFYSSPPEITWQNMGIVIAGGVCYILAALLFAFIVQKNELTGFTSYKMVLFATCTAAIPSLLQTPKILLAGFLVLLGLRRIYSLRSGISIERKLYDASFWLTLTTICFFWSGGFFVVLFAGIFLYARGQLRFWAIPLLGMTTIALLITCYILYTGSDQSFILQYVDGISVDFSAYGNLTLVTGLSFISSILFWCLWSYISAMRKTAFSQRGSFIITLFSIGVAIVIIVLAPKKIGPEWYFLVFPTAIIGANYLEQTKSKLFKEFLLWVAVIIPIVVYVF